MKRSTPNFIKGFLLTVMSLSIALSFIPGKAHAYTRAQWCGNWSGTLCDGYFDGGQASGANGGDLIPGGVPSGVAGPTGFINFVCNNLEGGRRERMGASMIVDEMMGYSQDRRNCYQPGTTTYTSNFDAWAQRVRAYANAPASSGYGVDWSRSIAAPNRNSAYASDIDDDVFHTDMNGGNITVIYFYWPGGAFRIQRSCANLAGPTNPLPLPPSWSMSASTVATNSSGANIGGGTIYVNQQINWTHTVSNTGNSTSTTVTGNATWSGSRSGNVDSTNTYSQTFGAGGQIQRVRSFTPTTAGTYCQRINGSPSTPTNGSTFYSNYVCVNVLNPAVLDCDLLSPAVRSRNATSITIQLEGRSNITIAPSSSFTLKDPNGNTMTATAGAFTGTGTGPYNRTYTINAPGGGFLAGIYNATATFSGGGGSHTCSTTFTMGDIPYFSVVGGDIAAGPDFGATCTPDTTADIIGSNKDAAPYNGAGAQLGALALRNIKSFATGKTQTGITPPAWADSIGGGSSPSELAFSNQASAGYTGYGGMYGKNTDWCVPDYAAKVNTSGASPIGLGTLNAGLLATTDKVYTSASDISLTAGDIPAYGQKITVLVTGDVYIDSLPGGGIRYGSLLAPVTSVDNIPRLSVIASGNIFVSPNVTRLDGFYAAQGGSFIACADFGSKAAYQDVDHIGTCSSQLVVNGAVAAKKVIPNRTHGDQVGNGTTILQEPAELFRYSPQLWLPNLRGGSGVGPWQSVTSLPPIL